MTTNDKIKAFAECGGAWEHLSKELQCEGASKAFADAFIKRYRNNLGLPNAIDAVETYKKWLDGGKGELIEIQIMLSKGWS